MSERDEVVLDASALIALLWEEPGAAAVAAVMERAVISTVNWTEVLQRLKRSGAAVGGPRGLVESLGVRIEPYTARDAELAADLWPVARDVGLSLADRACLALAARLGAPVQTADRAWADVDTGVDIVLIR